jgi:signal transduction histidine kinase
LSRDFLKKESVSLSYNPDRDFLVNADKGRISQVISNLLNNAIEFTVEGTILVSVEKNKISSDNEIITVSVKDTGQGLDQSILPRLFTKFASKSYKGTGLGLFISKGIIEAHSGNIWGELKAEEPNSLSVCHYTDQISQHRMFIATNIGLPLLPQFVKANN